MTRKRNGAKFVTRKKRTALYLLHGLSCAYCGTGIEEGIVLELDHLVPWTSDGSNHESNLVTCCPSCNKKKNKRDWREFAFDAAKYAGLDPEEVVARIEVLRFQDLTPYLETAGELIASRGSYANALAYLKKFIIEDGRD